MTALDVLRESNEAMAAGRYDGGFLSERWGLLPPEPPLTALPDSHRAWDEVAANLPDLYRTQTVRAAIDALPLLDANADALPDRYVWRASSLLGMFAHAYFRAEPEQPLALPESIERPWGESVNACIAMTSRSPTTI
jgi:sulfite reductase (NADPH) flavoprotein alpha-component